MHNVFLVVALVTMIQNGKPVGTATGFFYGKDDILYFVTNRHVVIDEKKNYKPDKLRVRLHTDLKDLTKNTERDIPLYVDNVPRWHVHKDYTNNPIDISVIELDQKDNITAGTIIAKVSSTDFFNSKSNGDARNRHLREEFYNFSL